MYQNTTSKLMWLCVYDPADSGKVVSAFANWPTTHWEFDFTRHGSPVLDRDVLIVSGGQGDTRFPLFVGMESADFVMFYFEGHNPEQFGPGQHHVTLDQLPSNLRNASAEQAVVAIELTAQNPSNSNAVQRNGRFEDMANLGISMLLVTPLESIRLKTGAGIAGGHGDPRLIAKQKRLIRQNRPTEKATLAGEVIGTCPFEEKMLKPQGISQWPEQFLAIMGDTFRVNTARITLPKMWSCIHDSYRYSGSQLSELYDFMREIMDTVESSGIAAARSSPAWRPHISSNRSRARTGNSGNGGLAKILEEYGQNHGFPVGSIKEVDDVFSHKSSHHHYHCRADSMTPKRGGESIEELGPDVSSTLTDFCNGFTVDATIMQKLEDIIADRFYLITRKVPRIKYLSKDTYTGSMSITDWLFTRLPAPHWDLNDYPLAVSTNPQNRIHVYAFEVRNKEGNLICQKTEIPFDSNQVRANATCVYGRRTRERMDLYRCIDGVFLGQPLADLLGVPFLTPLAN